MFSGGIQYYARTELVAIPRQALTAHMFVEDILETHVVPIVGLNFILMITD